MIKTKVAVLEGRLLSSQSEQSEKLSKALIGWKKAGSSKNLLLFDHVNRLKKNFNSVIFLKLHRSFALAECKSDILFNTVKKNKKLFIILAVLRLSV